MAVRWATAMGVPVMALVGALPLVGGASCVEEGVSGDLVRYSVSASGGVEQGELTNFTNAQGWRTRSSAIAST